MNKLVTVKMALLLSAIAGCAGYPPLVSMRGTEVSAEDRAPAQKIYSERTPGTGLQELIKRTYSQQPPLIPHTVEKYEPITRESNDCLDCHISDEFKGKKMPRMGDSHFSRTLKDKEGAPVVDVARWQCISCHVPQTDVSPLVENGFSGSIR